MDRKTILLCALLLLPQHLFSQSVGKDLQEFLRKYFAFERSDLSALARSRPAARALETEAPSEVAVFGIIYVNGSPESMVARFRDIARFKQSKEVLQIGVFRNPPSLEDLQTLRFDTAELKSLSDCRVGDCDVRLPTSNIKRFQQEIQWKAGDSASRADELAREMIVDYARAYLTYGNAALTVYNDKKDPVDLSVQFSQILDASESLKNQLPEFWEYLRSYPKSKLNGAEDFLYWSNEKFGLKPVLSLTHVSIYRPPPGSPVYAAFASKQIYASHYFDASLGLTAIHPSGEGYFLMYLNRSRSESLKGGWRTARRSIVEGRGLEAMEKNLLRIQKQSE